MIIILCVLSMLIMAHHEAEHDYGLIKDNLYVNHINGFIRRMFSSIITVVLLVFLFNTPLWKIIPLNIMNAVIFSSMFKYRLNTLRGLNLQYISVSNYYDNFFIKRFIHPGKIQYIFEFIIFVVMIVVSVL
jgi:hypothetical protein